MTTKQWQPIETFVPPTESKWIALCYKSKGGVTIIREQYQPNETLRMSIVGYNYWVALDSEHETLPPFPNAVIKKPVEQVESFSEQFDKFLKERQDSDKSLLEKAVPTLFKEYGTEGVTPIKEYLNNGSNSPEAKELVVMQEVPTNDVLLTAKSLKEGNRADQYGTASIMFKRIADFWNTYLGVDLIKAHDVGHMMALMKIARSVKDPKHFDSAVDATAYIALAHEVATESE